MVPMARKPAESKALFFTQGTHNLSAEDSSCCAPPATAGEQPGVLSTHLTGVAAITQGYWQLPGA